MISPRPSTRHDQRNGTISYSLAGMGNFIESGKEVGVTCSKHGGESTMASLKSLDHDFGQQEAPLVIADGCFDQ